MKNRKLPYSHTNTQSLDSSSVGVKLTDYYWLSFKPDTLCPSGLFSSQLLSAARSFLLLLPSPCLHHKRDPDAQRNSSPCVCCLYLLFIFITCRETISIVAQMLLFQLSAISLPVLRPVWVPFRFHSQLRSCTTTIVLAKWLDLCPAMFLRLGVRPLSLQVPHASAGVLSLKCFLHRQTLKLLKGFKEKRRWGWNKDADSILSFF